MKDIPDIDYKPGDVSPQGDDERERRDTRRWRIMQATSLITVLLVIAVGYQMYRQGKDREYTDNLVTSAQQRACDIERIRNSVPAQTPQEIAFREYFDKSSTDLDCSNAK